MKSPFPGMDPYLEMFWRDVHATLIVHARSQLQRQLGGGLVARIEERLVVEEDFGPTREIGPDIHIIERGQPAGEVSPETSGLAVAEPDVIFMKDPTFTQRYIEIVDSTGGRLITSIEFLSPSNKLPGDGHDKYLQKQDEVIAAHVNLAEIDLIRSGTPVVACREHLAKSPKTTYLACVSRAKNGALEIYRIPLPNRLPTIRIPLRPKDPDIYLDLQALLDQAYQEGAYHSIDYHRPCVPPLAGDDEAWVQHLLKAAGKW